MKFSIHGPISLGRNSNGKIDRSSHAKNKFLEDAENIEQGLSKAIGCYLFGIKYGDSFKPYYVGMASKTSFLRECFGSHKKVIYNEALDDQYGIPALFLIAKRTKKSKFTKPSKNYLKSLEWLESFLIGICIDKNPKLKNITKTKFLKQLIVPGILNSPKGRSTISEKKFRKAIFKVKKR